MSSTEALEPASLTGFRLSPLQERVWRLQKDSTAFHGSIAIHIAGSFDESALRAAVAEVVERHEVLRTTFRTSSSGQGVLQAVHENLPPRWTKIDLRPLTGERLGTELGVLMRLEGLQPFDLERGPLFRLTLVRLPEEQHVLLIHLPALCGDLASLHNLFREIARCYSPHDEPEAYTKPMPYAQFSEWQRQLLELDDEVEPAHWRQRDFTELLELELPVTAPRDRGVEVPFEPSTARCTLPTESYREIGELAAAVGASEHSLLLTAWVALLYRLTGRDRLGLGCSSLARAYDDLQDTLGLFEKYLPLEVEIPPGITFLDLLQVVRARQEAADDWQEYFDWGELRERYGDALLGRLPLCFERVERPAPMGDDRVMFTVLAEHSCVERFQLKLRVVDDGAEATVEMHFDPAVCDPRDAHRLAPRFAVLLGAALEDPQLPLVDLPILPREERHWLLSEVNNTERQWLESPQEGATILGSIARQCALHPEAVAVEASGEQRTYGALEAATNRLARYLRRLGVGRAGTEVRVGVCLERSPRLIEALLAILKAGGVFVPLDPEYPAARLAFMLADSGAPLVLAEMRTRAALPPGEHQIVLLDGDGHGDGDGEGGPSAAAIAGESAEPLRPDPTTLDPQRLAYGIYTSGSTGRPKAALNTHGALANRLLWMQEAMPLGPEDRVLHKTPYSFDVALWELFWPLMVGARMVMARPGGQRDAAYLAGLIATAGVTTVHFVPTLLRHFLEEPDVAEACRSLRRLVTSGEVLPPEVAARAATLLPAAVHNLYGPTEAAIDVTAWHYRPHPGQEGLPVPIGFAIANTRCYVVDPQGRPCPAGVAGELLLGGVGLARGYLGRSALTAERFVPNPVTGLASQGPGDRLYRTGDLVRRRADGALDFLGRLDQQVKIRGFRVEPAEIEAVLVSHPGVRAAVALTRSDGAGGHRLVAYVEAPEGGAPRSNAPGSTERLSGSELRRFLSRHLPDYLVPSAIIVLNELPQLPSGKVDRQALLALKGERDRRAVAPRNSVEALLVEIWTQLLPVDEVGIYDDFLELGGDSILSLQIVAKANQAGLGLVPGELLEQRTIANLARASGSRRVIQAPQGAVVGEVPLTPMQAWFFAQPLTHPEHWNQALLLDLREPIDGALLGRATQLLEAHHDALRSRFASRDGGGTQWVVEPGEAIPLQVADLRGLEPGAREEALEAVKVSAQGSLDLAAGPLWRPVLLDDGRHPQLLVVIHHLVVDSISWRILLEDLEALYRQLSRHPEEAPHLPAKTTSFQIWSQRLSTYAQGQDVVQQLEFWQALPWEEVCSLPVDDLDTIAAGAEGANTVASTRTVRLALTPEQTRALLTEVPKAYRTEINDVLLTALARAVSRWTGSSSLLVDMESHGREKLFNDLDLSRTVGWFTALYPVLIDFGHGAEPGAALTSVKEQLRRLPDGGVGYGLLRYLDHQGDATAALRRLPRPDILFNYLGQLDSGGRESSLFVPVPDSAGPERHPEDPRSHALEILAGVWDGVLEVAWHYSAHLHRRETIEELATQYQQALVALIEHCSTDGSTGFTTSDFRRSGLPAEALEVLVEDLGGGAQVADIYPLSGSQEGMLMYLLVGDGAQRQVFFNQLHCRLVGELQPIAFQRAWQQTLDRHPSLRTLFRWRDQPRPLQVVLDRVEPQWTVEDWREIPAKDYGERLEAFLEADRQRPFDLETAPLLRLGLLRTAATEHRFVLSYHHLILDGWSISLLLNEVLVRYRAGVAGGRAALPPVPGYGDYVNWLAAQNEAEGEAFWRQWLSGVDAPTRLRVERRPGHSPSEAGYGVETMRLSPTASRELSAAARAGRLTLNTLVQGAWGLLLHRYSGHQEVVFGSVVSGRQGGFESTIGLFINALPVRVRVPDGGAESTVGEWLQALQTAGVEQRRFEHCPLEQIQRWSPLDRDQPLFESLLVFENYPVDDDLKEGARSVQVQDVEVDERTNYPLALFIFPGESVELALHYDGRRFDADTARLLLADHHRLLQRLVKGLENPLPEVLRPSGPELPQRVEGHDLPGLSENPPPSVVETFLQRVAMDPAAPAVVAGWVAEAPVWSYGELRQKSATIAAAVGRVTGGGEVPVAVWMERSPGLLAVLLGILEAGAAYVPLDPSWPTGRVETILADCGARLLLADAPLGAALEGTRNAVDFEVLDPAPLLAAPESLEEPSVSTAPLVAVAGERLAYIIYTSGSTGRPKGVAVSHRALAHHTAAARANFDLAPGDRMLQFASPAFDASAEEIYPTLTAGAALVLRDVAMLASPRAFFEACAEGGITALDLPTAFWHRLAGAVEPGSEGMGLRLPASLRLMILGGERAEPVAAAAFRRAAPQLRLLNTYGPTEATVVATAAALHRRSPDALAEEAEVSIGAPLEHVRVYVVDAADVPVAVGVPGQLLIGGAALARGYLGDPRRTAERFVPDPFATGEGGGRLFRSGDLVRWMPDDELRFLGRLDTQVKLRGHRIEPGEIEALLAAQPGVAEAAVRLIQPDEEQGEPQLVAYLVPDADDPAAPEGPPSLDTLRRRLRRQVPEVMVPAVFLPMVELPRTAGGKVDRTALPALDTEPAERAGRYVEPRNEAEEAVADLFEHLLGVERVGAFDNFFDLGGHSLLATQLVAQVREDFEIDLPLRVVFQSPTVAKLAAEIARIILESLEDLSDEEIEGLL